MLRLAALLFALLTPAAGAIAGETEVNANGFPATLTLPDGVQKPPAVLFIAGSGPTYISPDLPLTPGLADTVGAFVAKAAAR